MMKMTKLAAQIIEMFAHMASMLTLVEEEQARRLLYALLWRHTYMDWFYFIDSGFLCFACYLIKSQMHKMAWTVLKVAVP